MALHLEPLIRRKLRVLKYSRLSGLVFGLLNADKEKFVCPICNYKGPFRDMDVESGMRKHAQCPECGCLERHRLQYLVMSEMKRRYNLSNMKILHFAPEVFFRNLFQTYFGEYETTDLLADDVDYKADITDLPFDDNSYDFVYASHVLEHVKDDKKALSEIRRVLNENGIAVLPVPLVAKETIEYPEPNPNEEYHVRAPGMDYFERYKNVFGKIEEFRSDHFPSEYQLYIYEDRSRWPTEKIPLRLPMIGEKHIDVVPVCFVERVPGTGSDDTKSYDA